ncbi:autotransporter outer membrane beta-barrel domain-containing protein [Acidithiobacillus ferridurans]|uniref:Autotransporter outer membrane beta-barrel domain-containing protein n=1 Tax=Acidithiobacillus ferridurans TaxID=1232575 RepID=A0A8X8KBS7_ACIFI|nr:autotransporter outer membrane beta-barrel domain-containing protein [Acidithiobacillus ferridurans]MBU2715817.1 autotransporter outer membrane beta-barrel domain-containing protein [Acidithiobacillus ferridurans]MBU2722814.1 autotransporter outer membrane beta-barrel domain-containing protein [Acidithiobacillus ferridurans]MBU2727799.1 autotransporter outer membrane beta-barrel domain-containing protein [Acidithiobacillus ferridurans]
MKKLRVLFAASAVISAMAVVPACAAPTVPVSATGVIGHEQNPIVAANNEFGLAMTGQLMNYQEHITPGPSDTESGWMPGFAVKGSYMGSNGFYTALRYDYSSGNIAYHGALQGSAGFVPYNGTDSASTQRLLGRFGYGWSLAGNMMLTPYAAVGWQHWNRHLTGPYGYTETYNAALVGAGAMFQYACDPRLVATTNVEMLAVAGGGMTPNFANGLFGSTSFGASGEEKVSIDADYRITGPLHLYGGLSYTHFNYTGGSLKHGFREPLSSTNQFGMDLGLGYSF